MNVRFIQNTIFVVLAIFCCSGYAKAIRTDYAAVDVLRDCTSAVRVLDNGGTTADISLGEDATRCMGYVIGVESGYMEAAGYHSKFCLPLNTPDFMLVRIVQKFFHEHPALLSQAAATLEIRALKEAFPC
jgi:hypothetical protein